MECLSGRDDDGVGVAPESRQRDDTVARGEADDSAANGVDFAGNLVADNHRRLWRIGIEPEPGKDVGEVDAGGPYANPDISAAWRGIGQLAHFEHVWRAEPGNHDLTHRQAGAYQYATATQPSSHASGAGLAPRASVSGSPRAKPSAQDSSASEQASSAFCTCSRFSAWSNTTEAGESMTSRGDFLAAMRGQAVHEERIRPARATSAPR